MIGIMNLNYIRKNDIHEKYLLGNLSKKDKIAYEKLLIENDQVRQELKETKILIAGLRLIGKDSIRLEIERQAEEIRSPKTDWSLLYKAAAILFVFVLVPSTLYFQLFDLPEEESTQEKVFKTEPKEEGLAGKETPPTPAVEVHTEEYEPPVRRSQVVKKKNLHAEQKENGLTEKLLIAKTTDKNNIALNEDFDGLMNRAGGASSGAGSMKSPVTLTKQRSILSALDKISDQKNYRYSINSKDVHVLFFQTDSSAAFPKSFPITIINRSKNKILMEWNVSKTIYSLEKKDIILIWDKKEKLNITFLNKYFYETNLDSTRTTAIKITKQD